MRNIVCEICGIPAVGSGVTFYKTREGYVCEDHKSQTIRQGHLNKKERREAKKQRNVFTN